jgi:dihydrofolate synthase/folylpolyglutamate synthase
MAVAKRVASERHATLIQAHAGEGAVPFQRRNFGVATAAAAAFLGPRIDDRAVARAAAAASVPGRVEVVDRDPLVVMDGAHNDEAMAALVEALPEATGRRALTAVVSILKDKDAEGMLRLLLPHCTGVVFTRTSNPRAIDPHDLAELAGDTPAETVADPRAAVERARELAGPGGAVLVTGSIYLIADLVRDPRATRASTL